MVIEFQQWRVPELYAHIGKIATEWGFMDFAVSGVVACLFSIPEAKSREKVIPRGLKGRLRFIGWCLRNLTELAPYKTEGEKLIADVRKIQRIRDGVIHGYPSTYEIETGRIAFMNIDIDTSQSIHETSQTILTIADLIIAGRVCHSLGAEFATFAHKLVDGGVPRDNRKDTLGDEVGA
jgi:hypothetical protein